MPLLPESFEREPATYLHWKVAYEGPIARLSMDVREDRPLAPGGAPLKLNSYDLGVDLELADVVQRLRFEHPEVRTVVVGSGKDRVFCAGANIRMLSASTHGFKVNFCKYTNETRLTIEESSAKSGLKWLAALNGTCAGGGYELALACDEMVLVDDGASAVSLPEVPLLGVLPGTGGLTRVVDKRKVRRDRADVFATIAEGIKGKRAVDWGLVDAVAPKSRFAEVVQDRAKALVAKAVAEHPGDPSWTGTVLPKLSITLDGSGDTYPGATYPNVSFKADRTKRTAELVVTAPSAPPPESLEGIVAAGAQWWPLAAFRELDDALLRLRFHFEDVNVVTLRTRGAVEAVQAVDSALVRFGNHPFVREVRLFVGRVLRRLDLLTKSTFAVLDAGSCFAGSLAELALAADRVYALDDDTVRVAFDALNSGGLLPAWDGRSRAEKRLPGATLPAGPIGAAEADALGLVTVLADDIDFDDELRVAVEERASLSPDALTGMEANLRCVGAEGPDLKIFGRLSAWQNWIFTRPNATGPSGALTRYGHPEKPSFDFRRT